MWDKFKKVIGNTVKEFIDEGTRERLKDIIKENVLPFIADELTLVLDDFFPELKLKLEAAMLVAIREAIKKEFMPEFDNNTLDKISNKISNSVLNKVLPKVMIRIKEDLLTEEFILNVLLKIFESSAEEKEPDASQNKKKQSKDKLEFKK